MSDLFTMAHAARYLGTTNARVEALCDGGWITRRFRHGTFWVSRASIDAYVAEQGGWAAMREARRQADRAEAAARRRVVAEARAWQFQSTCEALPVLEERAREILFRNRRREARRRRREVAELLLRRPARRL